MIETLVALIAAALSAHATTDRIVDANGVTLHIRCGGDRRAGAPVVVLEAGAGRTTKTWDNVFEPIAGFARVCAYDRQGMGSSAATPTSQGIDAVVGTLHALLKNAGELPPYVMAGHSWGGALVRFYATVYPSEVEGLVLIDSSHEEQTKRFAALVGGSTASAAGASEQRMTEWIDAEGMESKMTNRPWRANIPLVVLAHSPSTDPPGDPGGLLWQELQRELATRSPQGEYIVAQKGVGHFIQNQQPALVIDVVRRVVTKARGGAPVEAADSIQGRWKLIKAEDLRADGSVARLPWGQHPVGSIVVDGGSCYVQIMSSDVPSFPPGATSINDQMKASLLSSYIAYSGPCTIDEAAGSLVLKVEAAWRPDYVGTEQKRFFTFENGKLLFGPAPGSMRSGGEALTRRLTLERPL